MPGSCAIFFKSYENTGSKIYSNGLPVITWTFSQGIYS
jgi:hypothetical protein